jgi:hypothetical protein
VAKYKRVFDLCVGHEVPSRVAEPRHLHSYSKNNLSAFKHFFAENLSKETEKM